MKESINFYYYKAILYRVTELLFEIVLLLWILHNQWWIIFAF